MITILLHSTNKERQVIEYEYDPDGRLIQKTTPEGTIHFSYDDRERISGIESGDYHYYYDYGLADTYILQHLPIVKETNLLNNKWSEYITTYEGLPFEYFDSFYWRKVYEYKFNSIAGTPPGPTPTKVQYFRRAAAGSYETSLYYTGDYRLNKRFQTYLGRQTVLEHNTNRLMNRKWYGQVNYSGFPYVDMRFNRDNSGLITAITSDSNDKALTALTNNDLEIEQVQHTAPQVFDEGYTYDTRGNRLSSLTNSYTYNDLNQLVSTNTHTYTYDADGNMVEEKNTATTETKKFYYNAENRLIKYEHHPTEVEPVDIVAEYKYDIYGRRIQKNVNGVITNFFWEGDNMSFELNENNQAIRRYIYENGKDDVQGYVEYAEVDDPQYFTFERKGWYSYIKDQVGTITKVYKHQTKQMVDTRTYDVFGNIVNQTGSSSGNLGFQSKYFDQESGLNYYYHRYYYPSIGRFINEDPIGLRGGFNMYGFANNDSINYIDRFGLFSDEQWEEFRKKWNKMGMGAIGAWSNELNERINNATAYIWLISKWTGEGIIKDIFKILASDWCCFLDCITDDKTILNDLVVTCLYNAALIGIEFYCPGAGALITGAKISGGLSLLYMLIRLNERIKYCNKICN